MGFASARHHDGRCQNNNAWSVHESALAGSECVVGTQCRCKRKHSSVTLVVQKQDLPIHPEAVLAGTKQR